MRKLTIFLQSKAPGACGHFAASVSLRLLSRRWPDVGREWLCHCRGLRVLALVVCFCGRPLQICAAPQQDPAAAPIVQPGAPGQPSRRLPSGTSAVATPTSAADVSFMQGMVMHHGQAVEMCALIDSRTSDPQILSIGKRISLSQTDEMRFMERWLSDHHEPTSMAMPEMPGMDLSGKPMPSMPGMLSPKQMAALRQAHGAEFDHLFLTGMVQHHGGALTMVHDLFHSPASGQDADLFNFATDVDNTQRAEIRIMQGLLTTHPAAKETTAVR